MKGKKKWRGTPLPKPLPGWWLERVNAVVAREKKKGMGLVELGRVLAEAVEKPEPFDHGAVSRFLSNEVVTYEMVEAFVRVYGVPHIWYEARSLEEAIDLTADRQPEISAGQEQRQQQRLKAADQIAEIERQAAIDQTDGVGSQDAEGASRDRRPRRPARRGPSSS